MTSAKLPTSHAGARPGAPLTLRAAMHVHSTWSDGEMPLRDVRDRFVADGCQLVCMADHADTFDNDKLAAYVAECRALSDTRVRVLPGLEFSCAGRMHIVGYGITALVDSADPAVVIDHVRRTGGVSVIAHPAPEHLGQIPAFPVLSDGIEAWNTKYDGSAAPRPAVFELIGMLRKREPHLLAFYGLDYHWKQQFRGMLVDVTLEGPDEQAVLDALRRGRFTAIVGEWRLPSDGNIPPELLEEFGRRNERSSRVRRVLRRVKKLGAPVSRLLPAGVKSQLRRFFQ